MAKSSRLPGFFRRTPQERRREVQAFADLTDEEIAALDSGGLTLEQADRMIENVIGLHALPLGIATN
ncbi:MAG: 3-hydroxy-3-methylglutaryl-CoA reductase, partial [Chloroflexi bacterium]|nr:3-hydroxy-3-methylglutaryl-CoA reductase [Chloroflexota bacterium]